MPRETCLHQYHDLPLNILAAARLLCAPCRLFAYRKIYYTHGMYTNVIFSLSVLHLHIRPFKESSYLVVNLIMVLLRFDVRIQ